MPISWSAGPIGRNVCQRVNPVHQLALTMRAGTVATVLVNGREVVRDGRCITVDEAAVFARAQQSILERMARLGLRPQRYWNG